MNWEPYIPSETFYWEVYEPHEHEWEEMRDLAGWKVILFCECGLRRPVTEQMLAEMRMENLL